jgi:hypothetical protein
MCEEACRVKDCEKACHHKEGRLSDGLGPVDQGRVDGGRGSFWPAESVGGELMMREALKVRRGRLGNRMRERTIGCRSELRWMEVEHGLRLKLGGVEGGRIGRCEWGESGLRGMEALVLRRGHRDDLILLLPLIRLYAAVSVVPAEN